MDEKQWTLLLILFALLMLGRFMKKLTEASYRKDLEKYAAKEAKEDSVPVHPNMTGPCPPHYWQPPAQKGLGIMYQCAKCKQIYPRTAVTNQR